LEGERATVRIMGSNSTRPSTFAKKILGVRQVIPTYSVHDLHTEVFFDTMEELGIFVFDKICKIPCTKETVTLVAFKEMQMFETGGREVYS
jgi:DNA-binding Lrp family transcriptional regulator